MKSYIILGVASILTLSACEKKLELNPAASLNTSTALSNIDGIRTALNGAYSGLRSTAYYGRNMMVIPEVGGDNVYVARANSNRFISSYQRVYAINDGDITGIWNTTYNIILRANNIINNVDGVAGTTADKNSLKGQALFIRALAHFDLARTFAKPWSQGNGSQPGVPVVTSFEIGSPARNTLSQVYDQVIKDLTDAKTLLAGTTSSTKFFATQFAAAALLSRVHLYKGDNQRAIDEATFVLNAPGYAITPAAGLRAYYDVAGGAEDIFTVRFLSNESLGADNLGAIYLLPGYGDIRVSPDLTAVFEPTDARRTTFIGQFTGIPAELQNNKYLATEGINLMAAPKLLRLSEVVLNRAEAYAKLGRGADVVTDLNRIRSNRNLSNLTTIGATALLDSVLVERRRELMFEGHRFFDLTRNGRDINRVFANNTFTVTAFSSLPATDFKVVAPIPQRERDANPNVAQNDGY